MIDWKIAASVLIGIIALLVWLNSPARTLKRAKVEPPEPWLDPPPVPAECPRCLQAPIANMERNAQDRGLIDSDFGPVDVVLLSPHETSYKVKCACCGMESSGKKLDEVIKVWNEVCRQIKERGT